MGAGVPPFMRALPLVALWGALSLFFSFRFANSGPCHGATFLRASKGALKVFNYSPLSRHASLLSTLYSLLTTLYFQSVVCKLYPLVQTQIRYAVQTDIVRHMCQIGALRSYFRSQCQRLPDREVRVVRLKS